MNGILFLSIPNKTMKKTMKSEIEIMQLENLLLETKVPYSFSVNYKTLSFEINKSKLYSEEVYGSSLRLLESRLNLLMEKERKFRENDKKRKRFLEEINSKKEGNVKKRTKVYSYTPPEEFCYGSYPFSPKVYGDDRSSFNVFGPSTVSKCLRDVFTTAYIPSNFRYPQIKPLKCNISFGRYIFNIEANTDYNYEYTEERRFIEQYVSHCMKKNLICFNFHFGYKERVSEDIFHFGISSFSFEGFNCHFTTKDWKEKMKNQGRKWRVEDQVRFIDTVFHDVTIRTFEDLNCEKKNELKYFLFLYLRPRMNNYFISIDCDPYPFVAPLDLELKDFIERLQQKTLFLLFSKLIPKELLMLIK